MWFLKWWFLIFIRLNYGMTLTKKTHEAASTTADTPSDNELVETKVLDYKNSFDVILKDLVNNWQSPITYLKSRGYLTKELEQSAQEKLQNINVVTPLPVEKPPLTIKTQKINKKKQRKSRRYANANIITETPQNVVQQEKQCILQNDEEPVNGVESNLDTGNEEKNSVPPSSLNNPILNNLQRCGNPMKNPSPGVIIRNGNKGSKMVPINKPTTQVQWNGNGQMQPSKQRIYNWDGDYTHQNDKNIPGYMPEIIIWDGSNKGINNKPRRTNDYWNNNGLKYKPSVYHWDSEHNRLLVRSPTDNYRDGLVKNFPKRKQNDNNNSKK